MFQNQVKIINGKLARTKRGIMLFLNQRESQLLLSELTKMKALCIPELSIYAAARELRAVKKLLLGSVATVEQFYFSSGQLMPISIFLHSLVSFLPRVKQTVAISGFVINSSEMVKLIIAMKH